MESLIDKQQQYRKYIEEHTSNVWKAWTDNQHLFISVDSDIIKKTSKNILVHDLSKYSKEEFEPYRKNFFPINEKEKENNKLDFDKAVQHHYAYNQHHWNYWVRADGIAVEMNMIYIIEMICDWIAMGYKFNNTAKEYYEKNKEKINLNIISRKQVEYFLSMI